MQTTEGGALASPSTGLHFPEASLVAAGALGGPCCVYLTTPSRNALVIAALDSAKGVSGVYREVFSSGLRHGWVGGTYFALASCPGFIFVGPVFHFYKELVGSSTIATFMGAASESMVLFGSEAKNAQLAYNQSARQRGLPQIVRTQHPLVPWGPGIGLLYARNVVAMSGLRVFSEPCSKLVAATLPGLHPEARAVAGDFVANCGASAVSAPLHLLFSFMATQRHAQGHDAGLAPMLRDCLGFLRKQYLTAEGRLSPIAGRDIFLRVLYIGTLFTCFGAVERAFVANWPKSWGWKRLGEASSTGSL